MKQLMKQFPLPRVWARTAWSCGLPVALMTLALLGSKAVPAGEGKDAALLTLDRIFDSADFRPDSYGPVRWLSRRPGYSTREPSEAVRGSHDIVRIDPASGKREILVSAAHLIPRGETRPLAIEDYQWSPDESLVLIYTNSKRVWRKNTRGDYW